MRRAARMPAGVAALPRPSRLALTLALRAERVSGSLPARGSRRRRMGRRRRLRSAAIPLRCISSSTPDQRHSAPVMASTSSTAAPAPSRAAAVTAGRRPVQAPQSSEEVTISVQKIPIATADRPLSWVSVRGEGGGYLQKGSTCFARWLTSFGKHDKIRTYKNAVVCDYCIEG